MCLCETAMQDVPLLFIFDSTRHFVKWAYELSCFSNRICSKTAEMRCAMEFACGCVWLIVDRSYPFYPSKLPTMTSVNSNAASPDKQQFFLSSCISASISISLSHIKSLVGDEVEPLQNSLAPSGKTMQDRMIHRNTSDACCGAMVQVKQIFPYHQSKFARCCVQHKQLPMLRLVRLHILYL